MKPHRKLVGWGLGLALASLLLPPLGLPALILGILAMVRGRAGAGTVIVVAALIFPLVGAEVLKALVVKPYRAPSETMAPTIEVGDRFFVDRLSYRLGDPSVGDIVVFHAPAGAESGRCGAPVQVGQACTRPTSERSDVDFVQRIVAGPGDRVALRDGRVLLDGKLQDQPFVGRCEEDICDLPRPVTVPADHWFVLGDNRAASSDSRMWGPVPERWLVGKQLLTYWSG